MICVFLLGIAFVTPTTQAATWETFALIGASLFLVRPLAICLSSTGTDASPATRLFCGWFGARGLATALLALIVMAQIGGYAEAILAIAINAVWISALLHGMRLHRSQPSTGAP